MRDGEESSLQGEPQGSAVSDWEFYVIKLLDRASSMGPPVPISSSFPLLQNYHHLVASLPTIALQSTEVTPGTCTHLCLSSVKPLWVNCPLLTYKTWIISGSSLIPTHHSFTSHSVETSQSCCPVFILYFALIAEPWFDGSRKTSVSLCGF